MTGTAYPGGELELFARADNWKRYLAAEIRPFLGKRVLEVGAGIGGTTRAFAGQGWSEWTCLEPDPENARRLAEGELSPGCVVRCGTIRDLDREAGFDSILYIDVLEHIEDDSGELREAEARLASGGVVVVLGPAHPWLYSPFDAAIGHHRRYVEKSLCAVVPRGLELVRLRYLDSMGLVASAANRALLKQSVPTLREILLWDRIMVRASTWLDPVLGHRVGKSLLGVWRRPA